MRRAHPLVFVATWAVVTLLAVAGFAAFQIGGREAPLPEEGNLGHRVGTLAALTFEATAQGGSVVAAVVTADATTDTDDSQTATAATAEETPLDTVPTNGYLSSMQVRALVSKYFDEADVNRAIRVMWCESTFNPTASNSDTGAMGLFQHLPEFWVDRTAAAGFPGAEPSDPEANVAAAAYAIYDEGGWDVFNCAP